MLKDKVCDKCFKTLPLASFKRCKKSRDGHENYCDLCVIAKREVAIAKKKKRVIDRRAVWAACQKARRLAEEEKARRVSP